MTPNDLSNYAPIVRPLREETNPGDERKFEIIDFSNNQQKTTIELNTSSNTSKTRAKKKPKEKVVKEVVDAEPEPTLCEEPMLSHSVVFKTDILETEIQVSHVHKTENFVCLFYPSSSKVKIRPKAGTHFVLEVEGEDIPLYSPGVYVPDTPFSLEVAFFLVDNSKVE